MEAVLIYVIILPGGSELMEAVLIYVIILPRK